MKISNVFAFWGSGMYGGMQSCPYGASSSIDVDMSDFEMEAEDIQERLGEIREDLVEKRREIRELRSKSRRAKGWFNRNLSRFCRSGSTINWDDIAGVPKKESGTCGSENTFNHCACENPETGVNGSDRTCLNFVRCVKHNRYNSTRSGVSICQGEGDEHGANKFGDIFVAGSSVRLGGSGAYTSGFLQANNNCGQLRRILRVLFEDEEALEAARADETALKSEKEELEDAKKQLMRDARKDYKEQVKEAIEFGSTESGFCFNCHTNQNQREFSWRDGLGIGLNALMTGLGGYLGYKGFKQTLATNTRLGYPTPPYSAAQAMFPYVTSGIYGALSTAFGQGSMACGGTFGGGGGFGALASLGMGGLLGLGSGGAGGLLNGGAFGYPPGLFGSGGLNGAINLQLGAGFPGAGLPGAGFLGAGFPGAGFPGAGFPGASFMTGLGTPPGLASLFGGNLYGGAGLFGSGANSLLGSNIYGGAGLFGGAGGLDMLTLGAGAGASAEAYTEYFEQQMSYMERQMTLRQRYMEARMDRQRSIQGLNQEINKIRQQIQAIALSPVEYGDD